MVDAVSLKINETRFRENFDELSRIGATTEGGVNRPAFSNAHTAARSWFRERALEAGLDFNIDGAANHSAKLRQPGAKQTLLLGSHLDSVPNGGRFDGALGVVAALEVLLTVKDAELPLPVHLDAIDFTDEECMYVEYLGSRAFTAQFESQNIHILADDPDEFERILASKGLSKYSILTCGRDPSNYIGYLELHIEQGPRLEEKSLDLGIVTSIVGISSLLMTFKGRADHAGTTPMPSRLNAGLGASAFNISLSKIIEGQFTDCVANVGRMVFSPGALNVVPERVEVLCEFRAPDDQRADELINAIQSAASEVADHYGLGLDISILGRSKAAAMDPELQNVIDVTAIELGLNSMILASGAGHDGQVLTNFTPTGMILVPSVAGISHNPKEFTQWEDCVNGANALLGSAIHWAHQAG